MALFLFCISFILNPTILPYTQKRQRQNKTFILWLQKTISAYYLLGVIQKKKSWKIFLRYFKNWTIMILKSTISVLIGCAFTHSPVQQLIFLCICLFIQHFFKLYKVLQINESLVNNKNSYRYWSPWQSFLLTADVVTEGPLFPPEVLYCLQLALPASLSANSMSLWQQTSFVLCASIAIDISTVCKCGLSLSLQMSQLELNGCFPSLDLL